MPKSSSSRNPKSLPPSSDSDHLCEMLREDIHARIRVSALQMVHQIFEEEVEQLCGKPRSRKKGSYAHRAGSDKGNILLKGQRVSVRKPRVKRGGKEVQLQSYQALKDRELLTPYVMKAMLSGVSTRKYSGMKEFIPEASRGLSAASVSQVFVKASRKALDELNSRDLSQREYGALIIDAIHFGTRAVICVMGITVEGHKVLMGLREGNSENSEVATDLLSSLVDRGFKGNDSLLFVIDGGKALRKAIRACFGHDALVQRCSVHKERNILSYLPETYHGEFRRQWKMLHGAVKYQEALKLHDSLKRWLTSINLAAANSLEEAEKETLTVVLLETPTMLRSTLSSTNPIESCYAKVRSITKRVNNWNKGNDQISRWTAAALLEAEKGFRKIKGYREIGLLIEKIKSHNRR